jgi:acyl transferase domain-containing protein
VAAFDAPFFSVTAKEASTMDPMQRWTLEATYHAFENGKLKAMLLLCMSQD